eukprot:2809520-Amphidinium_carterae.1
MDAPVSAEHPLLPTPLLNQAWGEKPMSSGEGSSWLRHFLHQSGHLSKVPVVGTHCCKVVTSPLGTATRRQRANLGP